MGIVIYSVKIKPKPGKLEMVNLPKMVGGDNPHAVVGEPVDNLHEMEVAMVLMGATALVAAMVAAQMLRMPCSLCPNPLSLRWTQKNRLA